MNRHNISLNYQIGELIVNAQKVNEWGKSKLAVRNGSEKVVQGNNLSIGFGVFEFDATIKILKSKGIEFKLEQDGWIRLAHFRDGDNNPLFLAERKE